jgi:hypothetical protein
MKTCLIIGAGQLGSRHLQGIVKYEKELAIFVLDPSKESLKISKERESEIPHNHKVFYTEIWEVLPKRFDIVIIATGSNIRESIINILLEKYEVKTLILEKVLFQEIEAYERIKVLLFKYDIKTFVNHPRRMFKSYNILKKDINKKVNNNYIVCGGNWGLGCNALHFLDLFCFLSNKSIKDLNTDSIDTNLLESTREGYVEFTGTLTGHLEDNSFFSISSLKGDSSSITVSILNNNQRFIIQEGGTPQIYKFEKENSFNLEHSEFLIQYQSELTTNLVSDILNKNTCSLPSYIEASQSHEIFIQAMLKKYNQITRLQSDILPIT